MYFYLAQYSILCLFGLINPKRLNNKIYYLVLFSLIITVGLRYQVGGDWETYLENYRKIALSGVGLSTFMVREPGWQIFSYISKLISPYEIFPLNLMCATIFLIGIERLTADTKRKYFALAISYPILIILVGMGYTRQSVAIGFCFISLRYLSSGSDEGKYILFSILAFSFHNTAIFFSAIFYLLNRENKFLPSGIIILCILLIVTYAAIGDYFYGMIYEYIFLANYRASGAIPRGIPILIASLGFITLSRYFGVEKRLNSNISIFSIVIFTMMLIAPYTALDRLYLYFSPIYLLFLTNLEVSKYSYSNLIYEVLVLIIFLIYLIIWFTYGNNHSFWTPYNNYLNPIFL